MDESLRTLVRENCYPALDSLVYKKMKEQAPDLFKYKLSSMGDWPKKKFKTYEEWHLYAQTWILEKCGGKRPIQYDLLAWNKGRNE